MALAVCESSHHRCRSVRCHFICAAVLVGQCFFQTVLSATLPANAGSGPALKRGKMMRQESPTTSSISSSRAKRVVLEDASLIQLASGTHQGPAIAGGVTKNNSIGTENVEFDLVVGNIDFKSLVASPILSSTLSTAIQQSVKAAFDPGDFEVRDVEVETAEYKSSSLSSSPSLMPTRMLLSSAKATSNSSLVDDNHDGVRIHVRIVPTVHCNITKMSQRLAGVQQSGLLSRLVIRGIKSVPNVHVASRGLLLLSHMTIPMKSAHEASESIQITTPSTGYRRRRRVDVGHIPRTAKTPSIGTTQDLNARTAVVAAGPDE